MTASTDSKHRSFPKIEFTDSEAGALDFPSSRSRTFTYYTPAKKRSTMYEDVTVDVQPDPERHLSQGWIYGFGDGPGGYPKEWTAAKSSNWHAFLDPNEEWDQTIYRNNAAVVRQVDLCLQNAKRARAYDGWNTPWLKFIERNLGAWMHAENGLALHVFTSIQRSGPTNMINTAVAVNAAHKMRFAQDLALFNLDLSEAGIPFDGAAHKEVWQSAPEWQPTREVVERLTAVPDWCELLFATNIVFEQLVGSLFRSELVMQIAARNGDYITPTIVGTGEHDYDRDLAYTRNLFRLLTRDEQFGESNRELFGTWLATWVPRCLDAARALQPIWSQPADKAVTFASSLEAAEAKFRSLLEDIGLDIAKELDK
ncbi:MULTISPECIES: aromatic/alkene monooxygenase hydroxylase subunit beta [Rhodococcus]|uniref:propane 2-monooxygenase n=1 Tax=Rhodococcus aetherivorans TaxID=191292 RepID=A0A059MK24_9NOCA|nr:MULTISPECIES: aromatic/alkene monooxygenase hydroxylase subunit beta [Rhodococcus]ETT25160.1 methane/phenol/toluene hydroxylase [Rhodococcus rhodochrous ATCC 21198]NCL73248.1 Propane 2-monooxygenase, hydroxylase component small subunit [Rhodococcus sp. YH1]KDE11342.1 toluene hydroxylase [Rhodococcus aetherivorans]MBC2590184.1 toluene hydroxylase [Rhodococcus aetherivorans]MDV6293208.1 aromatic/alkene monooxygenase hydroxylase subunit beta [Rhodococcus aetherivorans]